MYLLVNVHLFLSRHLQNIFFLLSFIDQVTSFRFFKERVYMCVYF